MDRGEKKSVKVAFVSQPLDRVVPPFLNSIGIWSYEVGRRLTQSCDVIVFAYAKRGSRLWKRAERYEGVHYQHMPRGLDRLLFRLTKWFSRSHKVKRPFFASSWYHLGYALQVAHDLRRQQCDIVHIHNFSQFVPVIRALNPKIKIVLCMHCEWLTQLDREMIERRLSKADLVIGCSNYITEKIRRRFPQFASRCQTVYNGVDINRFVSKRHHMAKKRNEAKRLLFVGRVSPEKGLHVLLDAFQKVIERYPRTRLEIVGPAALVSIELLVTLSDDPKVADLASFYSGSYFSHLRDKLPSGVAPQVCFTGSVPYSQLTNHYRNADVYVQPSFSEAFGMPVAEAMASGLPVVAAHVGGIPEAVVNGKTGLLVESGDATALAEAILLLFEDEDLRESMAKAGRQRVLELFSWDQIVENLLRQYKSICRCDGNE